MNFPKGRREAIPTDAVPDEDAARPSEAGKGRRASTLKA